MTQTILSLKQLVELGVTFVLLFLFYNISVLILNARQRHWYKALVG